MENKNNGLPLVFIRFLPLVLFAMVLPLLGSMVLAQKDTLSTQDKDFIKNAASGGMLEVKLGQVAAEQAANPDVKKFGHRMMTDHSMANQELNRIAEKEGFTPPSAMDKKDEETFEKLSKLKGADFDRAYMRDMLSDHEKDIADFQKEAKDGKNTDVKQFAAGKVLTLQEHLKMAKDTHAELERAHQ
jgi:putative membrane protein